MVIVHEDSFSARSREETGSAMSKTVAYTAAQDGSRPRQTSTASYKTCLPRHRPCTTSRMFLKTQGHPFTPRNDGLPKGVMFTHRQLVLHPEHRHHVRLHEDTHAVFLHRCLHAHHADVYVHAGLSYLAIHDGVEARVISGKYEPRRCCSAHLGEKVTISHCVPTIMQCWWHRWRKRSTSRAGR